jgi:hypothetical protein
MWQKKKGKNDTSCVELINSQNSRSDSSESFIDLLGSSPSSPPSTFFDSRFRNKYQSSVCASYQH